MASHSYILLGSKDRGKLLSKCKEGYITDTHGLSATPTFLYSFRDEDVAPLTDGEYVLLDAIRSLETRFAVYSSPWKLKWGLGLKVGDTVLARLPDRSGNYATAIIRWCGLTFESGVPFDSKLYLKIGVEIVEPQYRGCGNSDGRFILGNKPFFTCDKNCGLFLTLADLEKPGSSNGVSRFANLQDKLKRMSEDQVAELLRTNREKLKKAVTFDMTWLADEMHSVGLLPDDVHGDVTNPRSMLTEDQKATEIIGALDKLVSINPTNFMKFVDILKKKPIYSDVVDLIMKHCNI